MTSVAVVHDYLTQRGGAERVALALSEIFGAPIFTSLYQPELTFEGFASRQVHTSGLQRFVPRGRFRWATPALGPVFEHLDLAAFDRIVVSTSGFAHHVRHSDAYVYCHTPPRFIHDVKSYFGSGVAAKAARPGAALLRARDVRAARRHRRYAANSHLTAERIRAIYGNASSVIHPPLHTDHLPAEVTPPPARPRALVVARLQPYKRVDVAIEACALAGVPLTVVGGGSDEARLRSLAGPDVAFVGRVTDSELAELFESHGVVLTPGVEDFGFAPLEANYAGRPVVARNAGGSLETVRAGATGELVDSDDPGIWAETIKDVLDREWDPARLREATTPFGRPAFDVAIRRWVMGDEGR